MTRRVAFAVVLAAALGCEPKGTPVTLESPASNKSDLSMQWYELAKKLRDEGRGDEALYAIDQSVRLTRDCQRDSEQPACQGRSEALMPNVLGMAHQVFWNGELRTHLLFRARVLNELKHYRAGFKQAEEAEKLLSNFVGAAEVKADALFGLQQYNEAMEIYRANKTAAFRQYYAGARIAHCLARLKRPDDARAALAAVEQDIANMKGPYATVFDNPGNEGPDARAEIEAVRGELR